MSEFERVPPLMRKPGHYGGKGIQDSLGWVKRLPEDTSLQRVKKIAAYMELLAFILLVDEPPGSTQSNDGEQPGHRD
jgi:hypothetical protein